MEHEIHNLISLDEIKHFLRVTSDVDDQLIKTLLETALFHLEVYLCKTIIQKTYEQVLTKSKEVLTHTPVLEIQSVKTQCGNDVSYNLQDNVIEVNNNEQPLIITYKGGLFTVKIPPELKVVLMEIVSFLYNSPTARESLNSILTKFNSFRNFKL